MIRVIVRVLFLHELSCSEVGLHDVEAGRNVAQTERCAFCGSLRCGYGLACDIAYENSLAGVRRPIGLRPPVGGWSFETLCFFILTMCSYINYKLSIDKDFFQKR